MRLKATVWFTLKGILVQWKQVLLMYAIFPLLLSTCMGYFQRDIFKPDANMEKINIKIIDQDNTETSKAFAQLFREEGLKELFTVNEKDDYVITIPNGYQESVINLRDTNMMVDERERISRNNELIIKAVIERYGKYLTQNAIITNKIETMETADRKGLYEDVIYSINKSAASQAVKVSLVKGERILSSYENQAAALITYMVIMMIMGCAAGHHLDMENGSFRRLMSTPINKTTMFNLNFVTYFVTSFIYGALYVATLRAVGYAFIGTSIFNILAILLCQSILISAIAGLVTAFFNKKNSNIILIIVMYYQILFGGVFIPVKDITSKVFMFLTRFSPGNVLSSAYRSCILNNSFGKISEYLLIMLLVSMAAYVISIVKVRLRWEE